MKDSIKMVAALVIFSTVACVALAVVYDVTKAPIKQNDIKKTQEALEQVFHGADSFDRVDDQISSEASKVKIEECYDAKQNGETVGVAIIASTAGFAAPIKALVGVLKDGTISGVEILANTDTPGLGLQASNPMYFIDKPVRKKTFYGQFAGMKTDGTIKVDKDGGDVVAITAATITSRAVSMLVNEAATVGAKRLAARGGVQ